MTIPLRPQRLILQPSASDRPPSIREISTYGIDKQVSDSVVSIPQGTLLSGKSRQAFAGSDVT